METKLNKIKERFKISIKNAEDNNEDMDVASWNYQEGILISYNDAKLLLEIINKYNKEEK